MGSGEVPKSVLFVPLVVGGRAIGRISLQNLDREHAFTEADARLLTTLAASLSVTLENLRLFDESQRRGSEMAALAELGREVGGLLDLDAVIRRIGERAKDLLRADTSAVFLEEGPGAERYLPLVALGKIGRAHHGGRDQPRRGRGRRPGESRCGRGRERPRPAIRGRCRSRVQRTTMRNV